MDRTAVKVSKSKKSASSIAERRKAWDEVNAAVGKNKAGVNKFAGLADEDGQWEDEVDELDDEMDEAEPIVPAAGAGTSGSAATTLAAPPPLDDDEIL